MREVVAECEKPVMLYSIGKDSAVMLHLARKAFYPAPAAVSAAARRHDLEVQGDVRVPRPHGARKRHAAARATITRRPGARHQPVRSRLAVHTDVWKTEGLKQALDQYGFDAAFGGARRDEEKMPRQGAGLLVPLRQHRWDPKNQRPELWNLYNARKAKGESIRVFPLSNWTELDIWQYIHLEDIPIVPLVLRGAAPGGRARRAAVDGR